MDLWRGRMTPRRATVLALRLPAGAQVWQALGEANAWTWDQHIGVSVMDRLNVLIWQQTEGGSKGENAPEPTPRPGGEAAQRADRTIEKARAFRERQKAKELASE